MPTEKLAEYIFKSSAGRPAHCNHWCKLAFYNIGWIEASKKPRHSKEGLATEIYSIVHDKNVETVDISEVFNLKDDLGDKRQIIMQHVVTKLNSSAARPAWTGRSDGHYIFIWNSSRLLLRFYKYVSCSIKEHPWRMAQYFQFQRADLQDDPPLHVCHNHSPSSGNGKLTDERRTNFPDSVGHCVALSFQLKRTACCNLRRRLQLPTFAMDTMPPEREVHTSIQA